MDRNKIFSLTGFLVFSVIVIFAIFKYVRVSDDTDIPIKLLLAGVMLAFIILTIKNYILKDE